MILSLLDGRTPKISSNSMVAETAQIIGEVEISDDCSIWFGTVIRGDVNKIYIGKHSNVQDNSVIHSTPQLPTIIGNYVSIGHNAILHGCTIEDGCIIGMGSIILNGSFIGAGSIIGAGAVVPPETIIPPNSLVMGVPAQIIKTLPESRKDEGKNHALNYAKMWKKHYGERT